MKEKTKATQVEAFLPHQVTAVEAELAGRLRETRKAADQPTLAALEDLERARRLQETKQVLAQPHRLGDDSDMVDPLGVFVRANQCGRECYEAGWDYYRLVYRWRRAVGIPNPVKLQEVANASGGELEDKTVREWRGKIKRCEGSMRCSGVSGFNAAQALLLEAIFPSKDQAQPVKRALHSLAIELGRFLF